MLTNLNSCDFQTWEKIYLIYNFSVFQRSSTHYPNHFIINQITVKHQVNEFKVQCVSMTNWKHSQRSLHSAHCRTQNHKWSFTEQMYNIMKNPTFCTILICNHVKLNLSLFGTILCTIMNTTSFCLEFSNLRQTMRIQIGYLSCISHTNLMNS